MLIYGKTVNVCLSKYRHAQSFPKKQFTNLYFVAALNCCKKRTSFSK